MPARKPVEAHLRNGTYRADRHAPPVLVGGRPSLDELREPPADLTSADAQHFWRTTVVRLIDVGIVDRVDVVLLEQLAIQDSRIRAAQRVIESEGFFARGSTGQIKEAPWVKMERESTALFHKLADQFALTPLARTRLGVAELTRRSLREELEQVLGGPVLRPLETSRDDINGDVPSSN